MVVVDSCVEIGGVGRKVLEEDWGDKSGKMIDILGFDQRFNVRPSSMPLPFSLAPMNSETKQGRDQFSQYSKTLQKRNENG